MTPITAAVIISMAVVLAVAAVIAKAKGDVDISVIIDL